MLRRLLKVTPREIIFPPIATVNGVSGFVAQDLVAKSNDWPQITKIERELISIYRLTERSAEADEAERRLSTLSEVVQ